MSKQQLVEAETRLDSLLALQPVYASNFELKAFDLLLEGGAERSLDDMQSLSRMVVNSYSSIHSQGRLQAIPCFLRLSEALLLDPRLTELPLRYYILEVEGTPNPSPALHERLRELANKGHLLALSGAGARHSPLLDVVHILRLDVADQGSEDLDALLRELKPRNLDLCADRVSDLACFRRCFEAGFKYFRGDFHGTPEQLRQPPPGSNKILLLQLLAELDNPATNLEKLEQIIIRDAGLTYKFLKAVNSATYGIRREIETLSPALAILGTQQIRRWVSLFLLEGHDNKPQDLVRSMLVRGRMCEIISELTRSANPISYFIVGLLSQLDTLTDIAMPDLMAQVPLNREIKDALLRRAGDAGHVLDEVEHYEQGRFDQLNLLTDRSFYEVAYRHSTAWARQLLLSTASA